MKYVLLIILIPLVMASCNASVESTSSVPEPTPHELTEQENAADYSDDSLEEAKSDATPVNSELIEMASSAGYTNDFLGKARDLGYNDKQLEHLVLLAIPEETILNLTIGEYGGIMSYDGRYAIGGYPIDFLRGLIFLFDNVTEKVTVLPDWDSGYSDVRFLNNEIFYISMPQVGGADYEAGIRFYDAKKPEKHYAAWNLTDGNSENGYTKILLGTYPIPGKEAVIAFWCEIPTEWGGWVLEDGETYKITLVDYDGAAIIEIDTEIPLGQSKTGIAAVNLEKPNDLREPHDGVVYFDIINDCYKFDYEARTIAQIRE